MTYLLDDKISYDDTPNLTAFGRLRVASTRLLGEYRYMYGVATVNEFNDKIEGNGTLSVDLTRTCALSNVTTTSGDRVVRQTKQYHPYISGTTTLGYITFTLNQPKANLVQQVGMFDDDNGFFFRMNGLVPEVVVRKNGVDNAVAKENWNVDRLDGSLNEFNKSGFLLDPSKSQILGIDYQWLGVGRVRFSFVINGMAIHVHSFNHANSVTEVYTTQPSLPFRWEIKNVGTTQSNSTLMAICAAAYAEGSESETGFLRSVSTGNAQVDVTTINSVNGRGVLAIRLRNTLSGKPNRALARLKNILVTSDYDINYQVAVVPNKAVLANTNIAWITVPGNGWCEYITNFGLNADWKANASIVIDEFATGDGNKKFGINPNIPVDSRTSSIHQNYDSTDSQILLIAAKSAGTSSVVRASLQWLEVK